MIAQAEQRGWERVADNNRRDRTSLIQIIEALEGTEASCRKPDLGADDG